MIHIQIMNSDDICWIISSNCSSAAISQSKAFLVQLVLSSSSEQDIIPFFEYLQNLWLLSSSVQSSLPFALLMHLAWNPSESVQSIDPLALSLQATLDFPQKGFGAVVAVVVVSTLLTCDHLSLSEHDILPCL